MVRTFIGIEIENNVIEELKEELSYLKNQFPQINWVKPENLHITLKFIGNIIPNDLRKIFDNFAHIGRKMPPFSLDISSVGLLPDSRHPRIVYAGCTTGKEHLIALQNAVETVTSSLGYPEEPRKYFPHITLARIKRPSLALGMENILQDLDNINFGITDISEVIVFMSELKNRGAVYSPMHRIKLEG